MSGTGGKTVLVADDDPMFLELMEDVLKGSGLDVISVDTGLKALENYQAHRPSIILLDVVMPGMNGFQVCEAIRNTPDGRDVPIIIVTGRDSLAGIYEALRVGATEVIPKPVNWASIGSRVRFIAQISLVNHDTRALREGLGMASGMTPEMILRLDQDGRITDANGLTDLAMPEAEGIEIENFIGEGLRSFFSFEVADEIYLHLNRVNETGNFQSYQYKQENNGQFQSINVRLLPCADNETIAIFSDVTDQCVSSKKVFQRMLYDELTGLMNLAFLKESLVRAMKQAGQNDKGIVVFYIDLDHFKRVNGQHGELAGDKILVEYTERLNNIIQPGDYLARAISPEAFVGYAENNGDEFIIVSTNIDSFTEASAFAEQIAEVGKKPFQINDRDFVSLQASIGIACFPGDGDSHEFLLRAANVAMKTAKARGRNQYLYSSPAAGNPPLLDAQDKE